VEQGGKEVIDHQYILEGEVEMEDSMQSKA